MKRIINKHKNFIIFAVCLLATRWSMADHYRVPTESMLPTIQVGDHVLVNKMAYSLRVPFTKLKVLNTGTPSHGDIIVFEYPHNPSINYVKRLIALPGDHVQIQDGFVKVNGQVTLHHPEELGVLKERLQYQTTNLFYRERMRKKLYIVKREPHSPQEDSMNFTVPEGQYFFMGDNRDRSSDSRYWGFVPEENLLGKVERVSISAKWTSFLPDIQWKRFGKKLI